MIPHDKMASHLRTCQGTQGSPVRSAASNVSKDYEIPEYPRYHSNDSHDMNKHFNSMSIKETQIEEEEEEEEEEGHALDDSHHHQDNQELGDEFQVIQRAPCRLCGRRFLPERLNKHMVACKASQKTRKRFDASKARIKGTELEEFKPKATAQGEEIDKMVIPS